MKFLKFVSLLLPVLFAVGFTSIDRETSEAKFDSLLKGYTFAAKRLDAFNAPYYEIEESLGDFGDALTPAGIARSKELYQSTLQNLTPIDSADLPDSKRITFEILKNDLEKKLKSSEFPWRYLNVNLRGSRLKSFIDESSPALSSFPFDTVNHYELFLKKSEGLPAYVDREISNLEEGITSKIVLNCDIAKNTAPTIAAALEVDVLKNPFYRPILKMPLNFSEADRLRLAEQFRKMILVTIVPAYSKFSKYFVQEYLPKCRQEYGIGTLPNGAAWYQLAISQSTDLPYSAEELHALGLSEVARILAEIGEIATEMGYSGSVKDFLVWMKNRPENSFNTKEEIKAAFENVRIKIAPKLASMFSVVPKTDYKIVESENPFASGASYMSPTKSVPYGRFVFNGLNPKATQVFDITTLSMHEAEPGHHFHLALQYEMENQLSEYQRKLFYSTAFTEGWGLYAESLGRELGMFNDPVQRFGHLNYELLRAVRLVVDTGIHWKGWSRDQVIGYMTDNLAKEASYISGEADRYSIWPGQALAYKVGQLKIRSLRGEAEAALGAKFDIKQFHQVVIGAGTLSLPVLEARVKSWIKESSP